MNSVFELRGELIGHKGPIYALAYDGNDTLYSSGADKLIARWSISELENKPGNIKMEYSSFALTLANNQLWIGGNTGNLHVVDLESRTELKNFEYHRKPIYQLLFVAEENIVLSSDSEGYLGVWDILKSQNLAFLKVHGDKIRSLAYDPINKHILCGFSNGVVEAIHIKTLNREELIHPISQDDSIFSLKYLKNKHTWLVAGKNGRIGTFYRGKHLKELNIPAHNYGIYSLITLHNENYIISCSRDKSIKVWSSENFNILQKIDFKNKGHKRSVNALVSIGDNSFASCGDDGVIKIWDLV